MKTLLVSVSLTNLVFLEHWREFLRISDPAYSYYVTEIANTHYIALFILVVAFGIVGVFAARFSRSERRALRILGNLALGNDRLRIVW